MEDASPIPGRSHFAADIAANNAATNTPASPRRSPRGPTRAPAGAAPARAAASPGRGSTHPGGDPTWTGPAARPPRAPEAAGGAGRGSARGGTKLVAEWYSAGGETPGMPREQTTWQGASAASTNTTASPGPYHNTPSSTAAASEPEPVAPHRASTCPDAQRTSPVEVAMAPRRLRVRPGEVVLNSATPARTLASSDSYVSVSSTGSDVMVRLAESLGISTVAPQECVEYPYEPAAPGPYRSPARVRVYGVPEQPQYVAPPMYMYQQHHAAPPMQRMSPRSPPGPAPGPMRVAGYYEDEHRCAAPRPVFWSARR